MKIQILMSTYNGGKYIRAQLDSIVDQTVETKTLTVRDDGSTDDTIDIIGEYQKQYPWMTLVRGEHAGVQNSFLDLLMHADEDSDYVALADQDDVWLPDKLERAIQCLEHLDKSKPLLYCSDKIIVDEELNPLQVTVSRPVRNITFGNALVQCICTGCTVVVNQEMIRLLAAYKPVYPENIIMHDWWLYLTATCFGKAYYDEHAYILYRQHGKNTSGAMVSKRDLWKYRLMQLTRQRGEVYKQLMSFRETYKQLLEHKERNTEQDLLEHLLLSEHKISSRICVAMNRNYFRQKREDDMIFRLIVLIGKL